MNHDEFAFFNQQLAAMLRDGLTLEGALKQLSAGLRAGPLRREMESLEGDLARGLPLRDALARRALPEFYRRMVEVGAHSQDLPGILTLLADHYHRTNAIWTRLKGLLVYPLLVGGVSLALTILLSIAFGRFMRGFFDHTTGILAGQSPTGPETLVAAVWIPPILMALAAVVGVAAVAVPGWRARLRWQLPAFREASLAELASAMALMLGHGATLAEALALAQILESHTPADKVLTRWRTLVETGQGKPGQWRGLGRPLPPLFLWLVQQGGEDIAGGFQKAADLYYARASYRTEMALYGALPVSILLLGLLVFWQAAPLMQAMIWMMNSLGIIIYWG